MKKITGFIITLLLFSGEMIFSQTINKLEYFIDSDPGFGNGTNVTVSPAANIANLSVPVNINSLSKGFHSICFRSKDVAGNWSLTNRWLFVKDIAASTANKLEYFVDTDPGFGNGSNVSITPSGNVSNVSIPVDISSLSKGFHNIFLRSRDNAGNWSMTNRWLFYKDVLASTASKLEYFVDNDPGFGNGTNVTIIPSANITDVIVPINIASLSNGFHNIYMRSRDDKGSWSITNRWLFFKDIAAVNLSGGEYFFDTDPGFGNGRVIPFGGSLGNDVADFSFAINASTLTTNGAHLLFIRTREANGRWSLTNVLPFTYLGPLPVEWLNFNAKAAGKNVFLTWQTSSEQNSSHFEVERSINGYQFEKIGTVKAAGNSSSISSYDFTDRLPVKGMNYYRLRQVDLDGKFSYSETRKVEIKTDMPLFVLYNNPSNGSGIIVKTTNTPSLLGIFDISGRKLKEIPIVAHTQQIDLSALPSGTYTAVLYKDAAVIAVEKIVIQH